MHIFYWSVVLYCRLIAFHGSELTDEDSKDHEDGGEQWPEAQVPYLLDSNFTTKLLTEFAQAVEEFHKHTCVRFRHKTSDDRMFLRIYSGDGCWSYVGMHPRFAMSGQPLSLGVECDSKGVILHELMHVLGFFHEHTRFDRDHFIILNTQNIDQNHINQFNKRRKHQSDETGPYDLNSILHYEESAFALDSTVPTIIAQTSSTDEPVHMGQRERLSWLDIKKINRFYNCSPIETITIQVRKAIETGLANTNSIAESNVHMSSFKKQHLKSFYWFKSAADFQTRTAKTPPNWLKFAVFNDDAHEYPRAIQCESNEESNCQDRSNDCLELALRGECERKPGFMLRFCRRSCCNCSDHKCYDTNDERKFRTLCLGRFRNQTTQVELTACQVELTRQNALDFCPKTCFSCLTRS